MKLLRKLFGVKNKAEPIKPAPMVVAAVKPPKPVITLDAAEQTNDESELLKLASDGATSPLRQAAAEKIHSRELLEQLAKTAKTKDKNVFKIVKAKLDVFKAEDAKRGSHFGFLGHPNLLIHRQHFLPDVKAVYHFYLRLLCKVQTNTVNPPASIYYFNETTGKQGLILTFGHHFYT